jgi:hypothetical protein
MARTREEVDKDMQEMLDEGHVELHNALIHEQIMITGIVCGHILHCWHGHAGRQSVLGCLMFEHLFLDCENIHLGHQWPNGFSTTAG